MPIKSGLLVPLVALSFTFVNPCAQKVTFKAKEPAEGDDVFAVEVAYPDFVSTPRMHEVEGVIDVSEIHFVTAALDAEIDSIAVETGDVVREGDVIAELSDTELLDDLELKRARLKEYQARLKSAKNKLAVAPNPDRAVTNDEVMFLDEEPTYQDVAKKTYGVAQAEPPQTLKDLVDVLEAMEDKLNTETEKQEKHLEELVHKAPVAGVILDRFFTKGNKVKEQDKIVAIAETDPMSVTFKLPQEVASFVDKHSEVVVTPDDAKELKGEGAVYFIAADIDPVTKSIEVRAHVDNGDHKLKGEQKARVKVATSKMDRVLVLPEKALLYEGEKKYIFVVFGSQVRRTEVETGRRMNDGDIEVYTGDVRLDDPIVINRPVELKDQSFVRIDAEDRGEE